jgi:hypothetical protein
VKFRGEEVAMAEVNDLMSQLEGGIEEMHARLGRLRAWLVALTGLYAAQLTALVAMALTLARR